MRSLSAQDLLAGKTKYYPTQSVFTSTIEMRGDQNLIIDSAGVKTDSFLVQDNAGESELRIEKGKLKVDTTFTVSSPTSRLAEFGNESLFIGEGLLSIVKTGPITEISLGQEVEIILGTSKLISLYNNHIDVNGKVTANNYHNHQGLSAVMYGQGNPKAKMITISLQTSSTAQILAMSEVGAFIISSLEGEATVNISQYSFASPPYITASLNSDVRCFTTVNLVTNNQFTVRTIGERGNVDNSNSNVEVDITLLLIGYSL